MQYYDILWNNVQYDERLRYNMICYEMLWNKIDLISSFVDLDKMVVDSTVKNIILDDSGYADTYQIFVESGKFKKRSLNTLYNRKKIGQINNKTSTTKVIGLKNLSFVAVCNGEIQIINKMGDCILSVDEAA